VPQMHIGFRKNTVELSYIGQSTRNPAGLLQGTVLLVPT
jgi:hypothetical protein